MKPLKQSRYLHYLIIFFSLLAALCPVILANNYLRQDDLMWDIWSGMKMSDFGYLYYNTVYQLVRPLCMLSFYITDLISINIHHSAYVRSLSVLFIVILSVLLYEWQLKFNPKKILSITYAICAFTLPGYQVFAATANYFLIIAALLLTFGAVFSWYKFHQTFITHRRYAYFIIGCGLFFASLLEYPLSSMYSWVLLAICYLNTLTIQNPNQINQRRFFYFGSLVTLIMMAGYYLFIIIFHHLFHVDLSGRAAVIDTNDLVTRFLRIFDILSWHSSFWLYKGPISWHQSFFPVIFTLYTLTLLKINYKNQQKSPLVIMKNLLITISTTFILFVLSYSPVLATAEFQVTYRYTIATMPLILYVFIWSINDITSLLQIRFLTYLTSSIMALFYIGLTVFGIGYANLMIADGIVGPHQHDFAYMQQQLAENVIPLIKENKKVVIHAIDCDGGKNYHYEPGLPMEVEYGMRICQFQQQVIGVTLHSMMSMGYATNYHTHNTVIYGDNDIIVKDMPWGDLVVNSVPTLDLKKIDRSLDSVTVVTIDTGHTPPYKRFDFYKGILAKLGLADSQWIMRFMHYNQV
jgi:hypothetical protein